MIDEIKCMSDQNETLERKITTILSEKDELETKLKRVDVENRQLKN